VIHISPAPTGPADSASQIHIFQTVDAATVVPFCWGRLWCQILPQIADFILDIVSCLYNFGRRAAGIGLIGSAISSPDLICAMPRRLAHISHIISFMIEFERDNAMPFMGPTRTSILAHLIYCDALFFVLNYNGLFNLGKYVAVDQFCRLSSLCSLYSASVRLLTIKRPFNL
jgi:hypothetical protein